jgi:hypothetical protein
MSGETENKNVYFSTYFEFICAHKTLRPPYAIGRKHQLEKIEKTTKFVKLEEFLVILIGKCISKLRQKMLKRSRSRNGKQIA